MELTLLIVKMTKIKLDLNFTFKFAADNKIDKILYLKISENLSKIN